MNILLLHPVSDWSLQRTAAVCERERWRLTIVTIGSSTVGDHVAGLHEWIRVAALTDSPPELLAQIGRRKVDAVVAGNEFAVIAADVLARELGVHHNDVTSIRASRNKALMRQVFAEHDVPQPRVLATLPSVRQGQTFDLDAVTYPVVVKPVDMAMSLFVRKCDTPEEVAETLARMSTFTLSRLTNYAFDAGALLEEFAPGPEYSLECVVQDGKVVAHSLTEKCVSSFPACYEIGHLCGGAVPVYHRPTLFGATERIAAAWGMPQGVMHVEFKMTFERISVIEAAARPAGDHIPELVELQHGISLEEAYLYARAGLTWTAARPEPRAVRHGIRFHFAERSDVLCPAGVEVVRSHDDLDGLVAGAEPFSVNRRTGYSLLRSTSPEALAAYIRAT